MTIEEKVERALFLQKHLSGERYTRKGLLKSYSLDRILARMEKEFQKYQEFNEQLKEKEKNEKPEKPSCHSADGNFFTTVKGTGGGNRVIRKATMMS